MNKSPLVCVVINCYNGEKYLKEAIDSVYSQSFSDWEIVFWDNASTDSSAKIAKSYDNKLQYFRGYKTISLGAARNKALEQCCGEFIAFLDCDDIWYPKKLEKQLPLFHTDHDLGLVYSNFHNYYPDGSKVLGTTFFKFEKGQVFKKLLRTNFIVLSTSISPRIILEEFNGFPNYSYAEEYALFLKIANKYKIDFIQSPLISYRYHDSNASLNEFDLQLNESIEIYNYWSNVPNHDIKKICHDAIGSSYYGVSRRCLFHLNDRKRAILNIKNAMAHQFGLKFLLFFLLCLLPVRLSMMIRKYLLIILR